VTTSEIEPATFVIVAQSLNVLRHRKFLVKPAYIAHTQQMSKAYMLQFDMTAYYAHTVLVLPDAFVSKALQ
jgi:hypothetical protein